MDERVLWQIERDFWLGGVEHFKQHMAPGCMMIFPDPVGILDTKAILRSLDAPRWKAIDMTGRQVHTFGDSMLIIAYQAEGRRAGSPAHRALCGSSYVKLDGTWRLAHHQQTAIGGAWLR